ncbi:MAG: hypothetical protein MI757_02915 [Pirellulales bacterium]|nr:hypothetical protein [Pirellulales bacterium]
MKWGFSLFGPSALVLCVTFLWEVPVEAEDTSIAAISAEDQEALRVGRQVLAIRKAIKNYESPKSLEAIADAGTITANYVWVRGWLNEELRGVNSVIMVNKGEARKKLQAKAEFLKRAIRRIDLE